MPTTNTKKKNTQKRRMPVKMNSKCKFDKYSTKNPSLKRSLNGVYLWGKKLLFVDKKIANSLLVRVFICERVLYIR